MPGIMWSTLYWLALLSSSVAGQSSDSSDTRSFSTISGTISVSLAGSYASLADQVTATQTSRMVNAGSTTLAGTGTTTSVGSTSTITLLEGGGVGVQTLSVINGTVTLSASRNSTTSVSTSTSTSSAATATNTQACNGWSEFCSRKYSNITQVAAHNAPFVVTGNAASNQAYSLTQQLNDGVRMLTGEVQYVNNTLYSCHTSCDLLDAGTLVSNLEEVATWVKANPYDVVTLLFVNSDFRPVADFATVLQSSGLSSYLYTPPLIPMRLNDWPTLSEMILRQQRVVVFMDYDANQTAVPYILDEFTHMWETPFSPQDRDFPCTIQRPPTLTNNTVARDDFMYLANHNLNQAITFAGTTFLIPNTAEINTTNAAGNDTGMLGNMANRCDTQWARPPNWLLVDFYNRVGGSVFQVAAKWNNVTYDRTCCGSATTSAGVRTPLGPWHFTIVAAMIVAVMTLL